MEKLRTVKLSGSLARRFGRAHRLAVSNAAEAVRALCATRPGFEKFLMEAKDNGLVFALFSGSDNIGEDDLQKPAGDDIIRIVPVIAGSKKSGVLQVIVGAVLIVAGAFVTTLSFGWAAPVGNYMIGMGISMIVGGIIQMLSPTPKNQQREEDNRRSYSFSGPLNVQAQGNAVPLLYGRLIVGSVVVSAGISTEDNYVVPHTPRYVGPGKYRDGGAMYGDVLV